MAYLDKITPILKMFFTKSLNSAGFLLVAAGVTVLNPDIVITLFFALLDITVPEYEQDEVTGWLLIVVGISLFIIHHYLNADNGKLVENDKENFEKLNEIVSQQELNEILNLIGANNTLFNEHIDVFDNLEYHLEDKDLDYHNRKVKKHRNKLKVDFDSFINFVRHNYFPNGGGRVTLHPDLRRTAQYESYIEKQNHHMEKFRCSYNEFRELVRKKYKI
ncbi:hypothetical protein BJL85_22120 [Vibrio parahaemolyticus]|uniref:hypothetical protein n=2 Tax=Vibrio parahaemolyticus TaxID=670 RepID=UPI0007DC232B|nr:hypothetical protein [Vibrio parahaemolyticus]EJC6803372.1 hypothetical protein [Vibrio parahaemolyticus]EJG0274422.1 hypothetical protein [Vibrio parahaemolyticus]EJG1197403.1 hypothetical protein [Vibrio parahaemolyticus]EJG2166824.1 hypothetical protein [Vibrio parahaemolyticus]EKD9024679.1 hypothetical protein [Vibrio parahaemolyticus]